VPFPAWLIAQLTQAMESGASSRVWTLDVEDIANLSV
jgi:hypothetical protein